jgi:predicted unusual protein kinase regulating ubiquinone biosynthesis (AarF/ABC1/UbiB family)
VGKEEMKEQSKIPVSKVQRASRFIRTGAKIGGNYVKHYSRKVFDREVAQDELHEANSRDIYDALSKLKGSALKVAQMMSMDKNIMPTAYQDKFAMAQYSAPPLSFPLVVKTFKSSLGKSPEELFDSFTSSAVNAASIGQVHKAKLGDKTLAVKIQYPGVADSISSDLKIVRPFATRLIGVSEADVEYYLSEVEQKLLEETDYELELRRSKEISKACEGLDNLYFPNYYPGFSSNRILTMDWLEGAHLKEFLASNPSQEARDSIGQALWDFYDYQIHVIKQVHADPHPGNFMFKNDGTVGILDFGCVKEIPEDFYQKYFQLHDKNFVTNHDELNKLFFELSFLTEKDTEHEKKVFTEVFKEMIDLLGRPFHQEEFDFGDKKYFESIFELGDRISKMKEVRNSKSARGPKHGLYINRTYFGLYNLLHDLQAKINTGKSFRLANAS